MKQLPSLPHTVSSRFLANLAEPDESLAVIIEVMTAPYGLGPLTVPGSTQYTYQFIISRESGQHRLIIPHSVWEASKMKLGLDLFENPDPQVVLLPNIAKWEDVYQEATGQPYRKPELVESEPEPESPPTRSEQTLAAARANTVETEPKKIDPIDKAIQNAPEPNKEPQEAGPPLNMKESLLLEADKLGVSIDKRWGVANISEAIKAHKSE